MTQQNALVVHVATDSCSRQSRVHAQFGYYQNSSSVKVSKKALFSWPLIKSIFSDRPVSFVFHQHFMLPVLLTTYFLSKLCLRKNCRFVYDIHDIAEIEGWHRLKQKLNIKIYQVLERIAFRLDIGFLTVSDGISLFYSGLYGKQPNVVFSISSPHVEVFQKPPVQTKSKRIVYFGQIKEERVPIWALRSLQESGGVIDLYGYFPKSASAEWRDEVLKLVANSGGEFRGHYDPDNLAFLHGYDYSMMIFPSNRLNIRRSMPNKLFQSLAYGLPCIISDNLDEVKKMFSESGYVIVIKDIGVENSLLDALNLRKQIMQAYKTSTGNFKAAVLPERANGNMIGEVRN